MVTVINNNTKSLLYTKCDKCKSELSYKYSDVKFEDIPFSFIPNRTITCPACGHITYAEMTTKEQYKDGDFPIRFPINNAVNMHNCCCEVTNDE